jgi:ATP-dependent DNA helicase RecQ
MQYPLREFQKATLRALENNGNETSHVLCIAPTGSGKSLIYERAASIDNRRTILITPLVALARQQSAKLNQLGIPTRLGIGGESKLPPRESSGIWIMSPEMLHFPIRQSMLTQWKPNLLVVDECHCLWDWGEHFRPAFLQIPDLLSKYSIPRSLWLTATLPFEAKLHLRKSLPAPFTEIGGFDLPKGLELTLHRIEFRKRIDFLIQWIRKQKSSGIVFVGTRDVSVRLSRLITASGKKAIAYHAGMSQEERRNAENLISKQMIEVVVATTAFGMGMDYPHLSYVVLWQIPHSILSLVQTIGRVGRSLSSKNDAIIFWDYDDFRLIEWTVKNSKRRRKELTDLLHFLESTECRRRWLIRYFDQIENSVCCQQCDVCLKRNFAFQQPPGPKSAILLSE